MENKESLEQEFIDFGKELEKKLGKQPEYQLNIYPKNTAHNPTAANADMKRKSIGVCFSGGGSRSLTCTWGQLIALHNMSDGNGKLLDQVRYISSVSGGTWASALYTFHPQAIDDSEFLGPAYDPSKLYYGGEHVPSDCLDVCTMVGKYSLGKVPQNFHLDKFMDIIIFFVAFVVPKYFFDLSKSCRWLWNLVVGKNVLADFDLYTQSWFEGWLPPIPIDPANPPDAKFFSLSESYAEKTIFTGKPAPPKGDFVYARMKDGKPVCPMLIVNTNIVGEDCFNMDAPMQIPIQVSPVAGGADGANPCNNTDKAGGGVVESFGFTSKLSSSSGSGRVLAEFPRKYTLADIAACSSAFYAEYLEEHLRNAMETLRKSGDDEFKAHIGNFMKRTHPGIEDVGKITADLDIENISKALDPSLKISLDWLVPQYNYWPAGPEGRQANKEDTRFTDGGSMDNTGVAGLLAQIQDGVRNILAFVNGSEVLRIEDGETVAATQMSPLFGIAYDGKSKFEPYGKGGINPFTQKSDPLGFLKIFDNDNGEFDALRKGLYVANRGGDNEPYNPAFYSQELKVIENKLLGIAPQPNKINILWVQNARVKNWEDRIVDTKLKEKINKGQTDWDPAELGEFSKFPYYSTFTKIYQTEAETNALAQMWAWSVGCKDSPLNKAVRDFFQKATI